MYTLLHFNILLYVRDVTLFTQIVATNLSFILVFTASSSFCHYFLNMHACLYFQLLLDAGANVEGAAVRYGQESNAETPLQLASAAGACSTTPSLISASPNFHQLRFTACQRRLVTPIPNRNPKIKKNNKIWPCVGRPEPNCRGHKLY